jgi:hypothetical protein
VILQTFRNDQLPTSLAVTKRFMTISDLKKATNGRKRSWKVHPNGQEHLGTNSGKYFQVFFSNTHLFV